VDTCSEFSGPLIPCIPVFDPTMSTPVYVVVRGVGLEGGGDLIRKTVDGGVTWSELDLPTLALSLTVLPTMPTTLFAQDPSDYGRCVLLKSTDRGEMWTASDAGLPGGSEIARIVADPTNLRHLFAGTVGRGVFMSLDGGATWEPTGSRPWNGHCGAFTRESHRIVHVNGGSGAILWAQAISERRRSSRRRRSPGPI
jgi:photosystem II stability/assembly factor-like uncharacterized protein